MSDDAASDVSVAEQHPVVPDRAVLNVATTEDGTFNTVRQPLAPVACWRLSRPGFAFDSSFVAPAFKGEVGKLQAAVGKNPNCPAALFGHCDPAGGDDLNKTLGDRRAIAIYALLTRQVALWADLYDNPQVGDTWGTPALQTILGSVADQQGNVYYAGAVDGDYGSGTTAAVKRFQPSASLPATGKADTATRDALFAAYMDWLCTPVAQAGATSPAFQMKTTDFLGAGGLGDLPKMSLQGCSEFNPVVLLPASEMKNSGNNAQRNADDAPNRRAVMFFFKAGTKVEDSAWPCPKVKAPLADCKKAFWPDGEARRKNGKDVREYKKSRDTMACRFYDRFARRSPCESHYFSLVDFFVYPDDQDGSQATSKIDSKWGDQLRLGWLISGTAKQVQIANQATGAKVDVTFATGTTGDGCSMGWVPLCVVDGAANADGVAEYQLTVEWPNGRVDATCRVLVTMSGEQQDSNYTLASLVDDDNASLTAGLGRRCGLATATLSQDEG